MKLKERISIVCITQTHEFWSCFCVNKYLKLKTKTKNNQRDKRVNLFRYDMISIRILIFDISNIEDHELQYVFLFVINI